MKRLLPSLQSLFFRPYRFLFLFILLFTTVDLVYSQNCSVNANVDRTICSNDYFQLVGNQNGSFPGGVGTPTWTQVSGSSVIINTPNQLNTTISGAIAGTYSFRISVTCLDGSRVSDNVTYTVLESPKANAGQDITACPGIMSLSASSLSANEIGHWIVPKDNDAGVTVTSNNLPTSAINLPVYNAGSTTLTWYVYNTTTNCYAEDEVVITNKGGDPVVTTGSDIIQTSCSGSSIQKLYASFGGNGIDGQQGTWSVVSGPNIPTFNDIHIDEATVSNLKTGTYIFRWTVSGACASGTDDVMVQVAPQAASITGVSDTYQYYCDGRTTAILNASVPLYANEIGTWVQTKGTTAVIENSNSYLTSVSGLNGSSEYQFQYTITNSLTSCTSGPITYTINYSNTSPTISANNGNSSLVLDCDLPKDPTLSLLPFSYTGGTSTDWQILVAPTGSVSSVGKWTTAASNPLKLADSQLDVSGMYVLRFKRYTNGEGNCKVAYDDINVYVSRPATASNPGTPPAIPCNEFKASLSGNILSSGYGRWSYVSGPTGATTPTIESPEQPNTDVYLPQRGKYYFRWSTFGGYNCPLTAANQKDVSVMVAKDIPTAAAAGNSKVVCYDSPVYLEGNTILDSESGEWSVLSGGSANFSNKNSPTPAVTGLAMNTKYVFRWKVSNACNMSESDVTITTSSTVGPVQADAGPDQCLTGTPTVTHTTFAGNLPSPAGVTGTWTQLSGPSCSITNVNLNNSTVTGMTPGTYEFEWALTRAGCQTTRDTTTITISTPINVADAGSDQNICDVSATLGVSSSAKGTWSLAAGAGDVVIESPSTNLTTLSNLHAGQYSFNWTVSEGVCKTVDGVLLNVSEPPSPAVTISEILLCGGEGKTSLSADPIKNYVGLWELANTTPSDPTISSYASNNTNVSNLVSGVYIFRWIVYGGIYCTTPNYADVSVTYVQDANAGKDQTLCNSNTVRLTGNEDSKGYWTQKSGPSVVTINSTGTYTAIATGLTNGIYSFTYNLYVVGTCPTSSDDVQVINYEIPSVADAGADQILCGATSVDMNGNQPTLGVGTWYKIAGSDTPTIVNTTLYNTKITSLGYDDYIYRWKILNGTCSISDEMKIFNYQAPTQALASDFTACPPTVDLNGNEVSVGTGHWTQIAGNPTTIVASLYNNSAVTGLVKGETYQYRWTITNGTCPASSVEITVTVPDDNPGIADAGTDMNLCNLISLTLTGNTPTVGSGQWTQTLGSPVTFDNTALPNAKVSGLTVGKYAFQWEIQNGTCVYSDDVSVTINAAPSISFAGSDQNLCPQTPLILSANTPSEGTGSWVQVNGNTAFIISPTSPKTAVTGTNTGDYAFRWVIENGTCPASSSDVSVTVRTNPTVTLSVPSIFCETDASVILSDGLPSGGTYTGGGVLSGSFYPQIAGVGEKEITYNYSDIYGCSSVATATITVDAIPTPVISGQKSVCEYDSYNYSTPTSSNIYSWNVSGGTITSSSTSRLVTVKWAAPTTANLWVVETNSNNCTDNDLLTITVNACIPTPSTDYYTVLQGVPLNVNNVLGVMKNDTDPNTDALSVTTVPISNPTHGTITLNSDGSFYYKSNITYIGHDEFIYEVCDNNSHCATALANIEITPNLYTPILTKADDVTVSENILTAVETFTSTDADLGDIFSFSISGVDSDKFSVVSTSGVLTFRNSPDFEIPVDADANNIYTINVIIEDAIGHSSSREVRITVEDVNEPPTISAYDVTVTENTLTVETATATDSDHVDTQTFSIVSGYYDAALFSIDPSTGAITFNTAPNYETPLDTDHNNIYTINVEVTDKGGLTSNKIISITVQNLDDNAPFFVSNYFVLTEGAGNGSLPNALFLVDDLDRPLLDKVLSFATIGGADAALFTVSNTTSITSLVQLTFISQPNFETPDDSDGNHIYSVNLSITDAAGHTTTQEVTIRLFNDNPTITNSNVGISVPENVTDVMLVTGTDPASLSMENQYSFSIVGAANDNSKFSITVDGKLTFITPPDYENPTDVYSVVHDNIYRVTVTIKDWGGLSNSKNFDITVTNVNDNPPYLSITHDVTIKEGETFIEVVKATDADRTTTMDNILTFNVVQDLDGSFFDVTSIDGTSNKLVFKSAPNFETPNDFDGDNIYTVNVYVLDQVGHSDTQTIYVTITNVQPTITAVSIGVPEGQTYVETVTGYDTAGGGYALSIVGGDDASQFIIDSATGILSFNVAPDYENPTDIYTPNNNVYQIIVRNTDAGGLFIDKTIDISVTPVNDNPPILSVYDITVNEGIGTGVVIETATATDSDLPNDTRTYSLVTGIDKSRFSITSSSGQIKFVASPDYENPLDTDHNNIYTFDVKVTDAAGHFDIKRMTVTVVNLNDTPPALTKTDITVTEGSIAFEDISATDADQPMFDNILTFNMLAGKDASKFDLTIIDATHATLSLKAIKNYETPDDTDGNNVYSVDIQVEDAAGHKTVKTVRMVIDNVQPTITAVSVEVAENVSSVETVLGDDIWGGLYTFSISGGADNTRFNINANTGVLSFNTAPDYETPLDAYTPNDNVYQIIVRVTDLGGKFIDKTIDISVTPVNDNPPSIAVTDITVNEGSSASTIIYTATATDLDLFRNNDVLTFNLSPTLDGTLFSINSTSGAITFNTSPSYENPIDFDRDNIYTINVNVTDAVGHSSNQTMKITVKNTNNNSPILNGTDVTISEGSTFVENLTASDSDQPDFDNTLNFSIVPTKDGEFFRLTTLTGTSTSLSFINAPNFESYSNSSSNNIYTVDVQVVDNATTAHTTIRTILVTVDDVQPTITATNVKVYENQLFVENIVGNDIAGGLYTFSISGGDDKNQFNINALTGVLSFNVNPDFENPTDIYAPIKDNVYQIVVRVQDLGGLYAEKTIDISVTPVNENPPVVSVYDITVSENLPTNIAIETATASDSDLPYDSLTYSILNNLDGIFFDINSSNGTIAFHTSPDYDAKSDFDHDNIYTINVRVTDEVGHTDTKQMKITILPLNDSYPTVTVKDVTVTEGYSNTVWTATATDPDLPNDILTFNLSSNLDGNLFTINSISGEITFNASPDYENPLDIDRDNIYTINVNATDAAAHVDTKTMFITVSNINDNSPTLHGADISINEGDTFVEKVIATDPDQPTLDKTLNFSILSNKDGAFFEISSTDGTSINLSFRNAPNFESYSNSNSDNIYTVDIQVVDNATTAHTALQTILVTVNNVKPTIVATSVKVDENTLFVENVVGDDVAGGLYTFSIAGGLDKDQFNIDAFTGVLSFNLAPDYELPTDIYTTKDNVYQIVLRVQDVGGLFIEKTIDISVSPVNDNPPVLTVYDVTVSENYPTTVAVETATASDSDLPNDVLTYTILSDLDGNLFDISTSEGSITFKTSPDYENPDDFDKDYIYTINVNVTDAVGNTDTKQMRITILPVNDNIPVVHAVDVEVDENISTNYVVEIATAFDKEIPTDILTFSISGIDANHLNIDKNTGDITFKVMPDYEFPVDSDGDNIYTVDVIVTDEAGHSDQTTIAITVRNTLDNPPTIAAIDVSVSENYNTTIEIATASDIDLGDFITSFIIKTGEDSDKFYFDATTGILSFNTPPDYENPVDFDKDNVYILTFEAHDNQAHTTEKTIYITVTPTNDNPPYITYAVDAHLTENATILTFEVVTASDSDLPLLFDNITYSVSGNDASNFVIDSNTGLLAFIKSPDADTPTDIDSDNVYDISVTATDLAGHFDSKLIHITVDNVNDNSPTLIVYDKTMPENSSFVEIVIPNDADLPHDFLTLSLPNGVDNLLFTITQAGILSFNIPPDYENPSDTNTNNVYDVSVTVTDTGSRSTTQILHITITNVNDNTPLVFAKSVILEERVTNVGTATATDADLPDDILTFNISGIDANKLVIDKKTGVLSFNIITDYRNPVDSDHNNIYSINVSVVDAVGHSNSQAITITVIKGNVYTPILSVSNITVTEGNIASETVTASDLDRPEKDNILTFNIVSGKDAAAFDLVSLDGTSAKLTLKNSTNYETPLDIDKNNIYTVDIQVTDEVGHTNTKTVLFTIDNVQPTITAKSIEAPESQLYVETVLGYDIAGGLYTFSISGGADANQFKINSTSGIVSFNVTPQYNYPTDLYTPIKNNVYQIKVRVTDLGGLYAEQTIDISVTPVNDNTPILSVYNITVDEGIGTSVVIETATATDSDLPVDVLTYSILPTIDGTMFSISTSGAITFKNSPDCKNPLDTDKNNIYTINVKVTDAVGHSDTKTMSITINKLNLFTPVLSASDVTITEGTITAQVINASDLDQVFLDNILTFNIIGGTDAALFDLVSVDGTSTQLNFKATPNFETPNDSNHDNKYVVTVQVKDGVGHTDTKTVQVTIDDVQPSISAESVQIFERKLYVETVLGNDIAGGLYTFSIAGGLDANQFNINNLTGVLSFNTETDYWNPTDIYTPLDNVYQITVRVTDLGGLYADKTIDISVTQVNLYPPILSAYDVTVNEGVSYIETATSSDSDLPYDVLKYSILPNLDGLVFDINSSNGSISFVNSPNYESPLDADGDNIYTINVRVTDRFGHTDTKTVFITVLDIDEYPPTISVHDVVFEEDASATFVETAIAGDLDLPVDILTFNIFGVDANKFTINPLTGEIDFKTMPFYKSPIDSDGDNIYSFTVQVTDVVGNTASEAMTVTVATANKFAPVLSLSDVNINEGSNTTIVVTATDKDQPKYDNSLIINILSGKDAAMFDLTSLNGTSSSLTLKSSQNFETPLDTDGDNIYSVDIQVIDAYGQTDTKTVRFIIDNVQPTITAQSVSIPENTLFVENVLGDDVAGGLYTFSISGGLDANQFNINDLSGVLSFNTNPDYENPTDIYTTKDNVYQIVVRVTDLGGLFVDKTIDISVTPIEDNSPFFTTPSQFAVLENTISVATVAALDYDTNDIATFNISGGVDANQFIINPITGELVFKYVPDYEKPNDSNSDNIYTVEITATDENGVTVQQTIVVTVLDTDKGDNFPILTAIDMTVPENTTFVERVSAVDADTPLGDILRFSITGGDDANQLVINPITGDLSFKNPPIYDSPTDVNSDNVYQVQITVSDFGGHTDTKLIDITILNSKTNMYPPQIEAVSLIVPEYTIDVETVTATDADLIDKLTFSIVGGVDANQFTINDLSGLLSFKNAPVYASPADVNKDNVYEVALQVVDKAGLTSSKTIYITVEGQNQYSPIITSLNPTISENSTTVKIYATDGDLPNDILTFNIIGGKDADKVTIDPSTGIITFKQAPDYEQATDSNSDNVVEVIVKVVDENGHSTTQNVLISVLPVNDNSPILSVYDVTMTSAITFVEYATAIDKDLPNEILSFNISGGVDANLFTINTLTGELNFKATPNANNPLDLNKDNIYQIQVTVQDGVNHTDTKTLNVTVLTTNVKDIDKVVITNTLTVPELTAFVDIASFVRSDLKADLNFVLIGGIDVDKFTVEASSGRLTFVQLPDYERPADSNKDNVYTVILNVTDSQGNSLTQKVNVIITDIINGDTPYINDNTPVITTTQAIYTVYEGTIPVTTLTATDSNSTTAVTFAIRSGTDKDKFIINTVTGELLFKTAPNYDYPTDSNSDNSYLLTVIVYDSEGNSATKDLTVNVLPLDEYPPVIISANNFVLPEGITDVVVVEAVDNDKTDHLTYSIAGGVDAPQFSIDATSGKLVFINPPLFDTPTDNNSDNVYSLIVKVVDVVGNIDTQLITVTINGNYPPIIVSPNYFVVKETKTIITDVLFTDKDVVDSWIYDIIGGVDKDQFTIDSSIGTLSFINAPHFDTPTDANSDNIYTVNVRVTDSYGNVDTQEITVEIQKVINEIVIENNMYQTVWEGEKYVTTVQPTEPQASTYYSYSITGGVDMSLFTIDPLTGILSFNNPPDYENPSDNGKDNIYNIVVTVRDSKGLTGTQNFTINVLNLMDNPPTITSTNHITINEGTTNVEVVTYSDKDVNDKITYSISGGADAAQLSIDATTGKLSFINPPHYETPKDVNSDNVYQVQVKVTDANGNVDYQLVIIDINPVNDNPPYITSATTVDMLENISTVQYVTATDLDIPEGDILTFDIVGGEDANQLILNPNSGLLSFNQAPDYENPSDFNKDNMYVVDVRVTDLAGHTDIKTVTINIYPSNDNSPIFTNPTLVDMNENETSVVKLTSKDADSGDKLSYSVLNGADGSKFSIVNGTLIFTQAPDYEVPTDVNSDNIYTVNVAVVDLAGHTTTEAIIVRIKDVNDNTPQFPSAIYVDVYENVNSVTTIVAKDLDANDVLRYTIIGGVDKDKFSLDATTGYLAFKQAPDYEAPTDVNSDNTYEVQVIVVDLVGHTNTENVFVRVLPVDDIKPILTPTVFDINENISTVQLITQDNETPEKFTYQIIGGIDSDKFTIDSSTGLLSFITSPDFDNPTDSNSDNVYLVAVKVLDIVGNIDTQIITINIKDLNDSKPLITNILTINIPENTTAVLTVNVTDKDAGDTFTFSITGGNDANLFKINSLTGVLTFANAPNFEKPSDSSSDNICTVQITVTDKAGNQGIKVFTVNVTDVNESPLIVSTPITKGSEGVLWSYTAVPYDEDFTDINDGVNLHWTLVNAPAGMTVSSLGVVTWTPSKVTSSGVVTLVLEDGKEDGAIAAIQTFNLSIQLDNRPPVAEPNYATVNEDQVLNGLTVLDNDSDVDSNTLTINTTPIETTKNGTLILNADGTYVYTPNKNFNGKDSFIYEICDNGTPSLCDTAIVIITVVPVNDPPTPHIDYRTVAENSGSILINVSENDTDVDGNLDVSSVIVVTQGKGTAVPDGKGGLYYEPKKYFFGTDTIIYRICDTDKLCAEDTLIVTVNPIYPVPEIPEGFSPNGDNINDRFVIRNIELYPDNEIFIYNRWGNLIYQKKNYNNEWDGRSNNKFSVGKELPEGTYFYVFYPHNGDKESTGYVYLKR